MSEESRKHNSHAAESWRELAGDVRQWADGHRLAITATVALVVLNLVVWLVVAMAGFAFPLRLDTSMAEFDFGKLFCTLFLARGVIQLILDAVLWLVMLSIAEPWLGRARTVGTALACALGGVIVGLILCAAAGWLFQDSQFVSRMQFALSPLVLPVGALMAASAFCSHLLRRRIRLIGYVAILVALLYSGNPGDYCILAAALIGHAVGRVMAGSPAHAETGWHWLRSTSFEARRMFAAIAVVLALGPIIAITSHNHAGPLSTVGLLMSPVSVDDGTLARCLAGATHSGCFLQFDLLRASMPGAVLRSLLPTAVTLVLAWGLYRGRRFAAMCAVAINLFTAGVAIAYYLIVPLSFAPDGMTSLLQHGAITACVANALPPLFFAVALTAALKHFPIRVGWRRLIGGVGAIVLVLLACAAVYLMYGIAQPDEFSPRATASSLLAELPGRFLPIGFLSHMKLSFVPRTPMASIVYQGVGLVFWIVVLVVVIRWMSDVSESNERAQARAERLVETGGESMSFMTTWEGNSYWLSPTGKSAVAYRVLNGIALTCTGPFGEPSEWMDDLTGFTQYCVERSLSPVFYSVHREQRDALLEAGWSSIEVGSEMVVDPRGWKPPGKNWQDVTEEEKVESLKTYNPHGRCFYKSGGDLVDHQNVAVRFANGSTAIHSMLLGCMKAGRSIFISGTRGEIEGDVEDGCFALRKYDKATATYREEIFRFDDTAGETGGHFGGDRGLVADFCHILSGGQPSISYTSIENSITGHLLVYTADESRKTGRPIKMEVTK